MALRRWIAKERRWETTKERKERERAENLAMRTLKEQKIAQENEKRNGKFLVAIQSDEFLQWHEWFFGRPWDARLNIDPCAARERLRHEIMIEMEARRFDAENADLIWLQQKRPDDSLGDYEVSARERRLRRMKRATPKWADKKMIQRIYDERDRLNSRFPRLGPFHVDHVLPIAGKNVSGLHVHFNLQVLPAAENIAKSNKIIDAIVFGK